MEEKSKDDMIQYRCTQLALFFAAEGAFERACRRPMIITVEGPEAQFK